MESIERFEHGYASTLHEDEDSVVKVSNDILKDGCVDVAQSLVVRVLANKKIFRDNFKGVMEQVWGVTGRMDVEMVGGNTFMLFFSELEERNRVWNRGPWHFDRCLIAMEKPTGMGDISRFSFNKMEIWVQIHNIPILFMNRKMAKFLADQIGIAVDVPVETRECRGKFLRVKVQVDVTVPLKKTLKVQMEGSEEAVVLPLRYERLPEFCFVCGRVGHVRRDCSEEEAKKKILDGAELRFGLWMRASSERSATVKHGVGPGESSRVVLSVQKQGLSESGNGGVGGIVIGVDDDGLRGESSSHYQEGGGMKRSGQAEKRFLSSVRNEGEQEAEFTGRRRQGNRKEEGVNLEVRGAVGQVGGHVGYGYDNEQSKPGRCQAQRSEVRGDEQNGESGYSDQSKVMVGEKGITGERNLGNFSSEGRFGGWLSGSGEGGSQQRLRCLKV